MKSLKSPSTVWKNDNFWLTSDTIKIYIFGKILSVTTKKENKLYNFEIVR